jgi:DNA-binding FadR family transcriptional regulator
MNASDGRPAGLVPQRVNAMEAVLTHLQQAIERGEYAVGDKLPSEAELCRNFEVSRSVVREALRGLQALGLTRPRTGKGTYVAAHGPERAPLLGAYATGDLLQAGRHLEVAAATLAASRRTADDLGLLSHLLGRMERETDSADAADWVGLDALFHTAVARASGNAVLGRIVEEIRDALIRQPAFVDVLVGGSGRERANEDHRAVVDAVREGSEAAAKTAMSAHLDRVHGLGPRSAAT